MSLEDLIKRNKRSGRLKGREGKGMIVEGGAAKFSYARAADLRVTIRGTQVFESASTVVQSVDGEPELRQGTLKAETELRLPKSRASAIGTMSEWLSRRAQFYIDQKAVERDEFIVALGDAWAKVPAVPAAEVLARIEKCPSGLRQTLKDIAEKLGWLKPAETKTETPAE